jgi:ubiquitin carboxyl-terminal hydrolase 34
MMCPSDSTHQPLSSMTETSRTRSDSLEALSLQQDRKRPRLDSGHNDTLRSEEALTDSGFLESSQDLESPPDKALSGGACFRNSSSPPPSNMEPSPNKSLSKVTINTRSIANNANDALEGSINQSEDISAAKQSPGPSSTPPETASAPVMVVAPPETISISSSPSRSPEIQIAVVEDIDQDPAETNWTPVTRLADSVLLQEQAKPHYVSGTFPYSQQTPAGFLHEILTEISKIFLQGSLASLI